MGKNENRVPETEGRLKVAKPPGTKSLVLPQALPSVSGGAGGQNPASPRCGHLASCWPPFGVLMKGKTKSVKDQEKAPEARYKQQRG